MHEILCIFLRLSNQYQSINQVQLAIKDMQAKKLNACEQIQRYINDVQYQSFQKKIPTFQTEKEIIDELYLLAKDKKLSDFLGKKLYKQLNEKKNSKDSKVLVQIKKLIQEEKQFEEFKKKINELTLEQLKEQLLNYAGKKKAQALAQELYQQLLKNKQNNSKTLQQIQQEIGDERSFCTFKQKIKKCTTVDQIIEELANYMGKKKAKPFAQKLYKQLGINQSKKDKILAQIEIQIKNKQDYSSFESKIQTFTKAQEVVQELLNYIKRQKAQSLGEELFIQLNKNKKSFSPKKSPPKQSKQQIKPSSVIGKADSSALDKVKKLINDKKQFSAFSTKLADIILVDDLIDQLANYTSKKEASKLAEQIFKEQGKDKILYDKIQRMYKSLQKKGIDFMSIQKIKFLVEQGKKNAVKRLLFQLLGQVTGNKLFNQYSSEIEQRISVPVDGSQYINQKHGLKIYKYKELITQYEKVGAKTAIVFGETGCGKTTFLNSIVNYIAGVEMEDEFRYKIIVQNQDNQKNSITSKITSYFIKSKKNKVVYRLVDTPGFGDTGGVEKDYKIVEMVKHTFKSEIESVHNILFLLKSSTTRVTPYQRYVFQSIMDLFNKNIAPNFVFIFTFSDSGRPQVLQSVKDKEFGFGNYWNLLQEPKYLQVNNCGIFQKIDLEDKIKVGYWDIGMLCMQKLFNKIHKIKPESLTQSRQLLDARQNLTNKMKLVRQKIENAIAKRQNLINQLQKTIQCQEQIDNNKDFYYYVDVQEYYTQKISENVTRCVTCVEINCHQNCRFGDGQDKRQCVAFDKITGNCTICPGNCHFTVHKNEHYLRKMRTVSKKKENIVNKSIYEQSSTELKLSQQIINSLMDQVDLVVKTTIESTKQMVKIQQQLHAQQMSTKKAESTVQYLQHLIANQQRDKNPGYQKRVKGMEQVIKEMNLYEEMLKNKGKIEEKIIKQFQYETIMERIKKTNNQGILSKFMNFFKKWQN